MIERLRRARCSRPTARRRSPRRPRPPRRAAGSSASRATCRRSTSLRGDLQSAYPDLGDPADARGFLDWAHVIGRAEVPIPERLLPPRPEVVVSAPENGAGPSPSPEPAPVADPGAPAAEPGVNVVGYLNSELGVGEVARQVIEALDAVGVPALPVGLEAPRSRQGHAFAHVGASRDDYPVNLVCVNADMLPALAAQVGDGVLRGPAHDRPVVVGGLGVPRALARRVRARRRGLGGSRSSSPTRSPRSRRCR